MRKRIVIGIFAILLGCGAAYVLVDSGPDTVEHHTKGYLAQCYWNGFEKWIDKRAHRSAGALLLGWKFKRGVHHLEALVRLGVLRHETIVVSNASPSEVMLKAMTDNPNVAMPQSRDLFQLTSYDGKPAVIRVWGKPEDAKRWADLIRKADVPAAKFALRSPVPDTK